MTESMRATTPRLRAVRIQPKVAMYQAFARLNYKPWYAIAEFVDNAVQSSIENRDRLAALGSPNLEVTIEIDDAFIRVTDNAAGISSRDFPRAFMPANPPPDTSGLSEYGIGMKAAACWFARSWSVRTSAIDEAVERTVRFDIPSIVASDTDKLDVSESPAHLHHHYTVLELRSLQHRLRGRTIGKIKDHLASIYRRFCAVDALKIIVKTASGIEEVRYETPTLLEAPYYQDPDSQPVLWRKELSVELDDGHALRGWAGLLSVASTSRAGFSIFRKNRLIEGGADETYRPEIIFKSPNKYTYQRLVGELDAIGFNVSHTKDGIQWGEYEELLLGELRAQIDSPPLPLIRQAEGYRVRKRAGNLTRDFGKDALETTSRDLERRSAAIIAKQSSPASVEPPPIHEHHSSGTASASRVLEIEPPGYGLWRLVIQLCQAPGRPWYELTAKEPHPESRELAISLNLAHPFSERFINDDEALMAPILRIVAALSLAETTARLSGVAFAGLIRTYLNEILQETFAGD